ncbi:MFS transporter [Mycolicibacter icosiumassiliensis]|uniref:MFS transporter n=1 Tax=Mycolicibacter icosiumassiliensis TaxID=1792835 RepID=UPI001F38B295|nr:MFS transporter [Mycolicibacter icosiumassiliensis]
MILLAMVCSVAVATIYVAQPLLAQIGRDLGVPESDLGWIVAAGQIGYLVGLAFLVPLGDMLDRRKLIGGQLLLAAVGMLVAAVAPGLWLLLIGLAVTGLFAVVVQTTVVFAADLSTPTERGRTLGIVTSGVIIGILGARTLAGILADLWGWRSVYVALMLLLVVLSIVVLKQLPADHRSNRRTYGDVLTWLGRLFREPLFISRGLIAFFLFASFGTLWSGLALPLAAEPWQLSTAQIGMFGIAGLAGALGAARAGRWADTGRANPVTGTALALLALSWVASGQATWSLWLVIVGVIVLDFAVQGAHVSNQALLTAAYSDQTSSAIGGYMIFYSLGSALGATATTTIYSISGWAGSAVLGASFALCGLLTWTLGRRTVTRTRRDAAGHRSVRAARRRRKVEDDSSERAAVDRGPTTIDRAMHPLTRGYRREPRRGMFTSVLGEGRRTAGSGRWF